MIEYKKTGKVSQPEPPVVKTHPVLNEEEEEEEEDDQ